MPPIGDWLTLSLLMAGIGSVVCDVGSSGVVYPEALASALPRFVPILAASGSDPADMDCDQVVNVPDVVQLVSVAFRGGVYPSPCYEGDHWTVVTERNSIRS